MTMSSDKDDQTDAVPVKAGAVAKPSTTEVATPVAGVPQRRKYAPTSYIEAPTQPQISKFVAGGLLIGAAFFGGLGSWAALAPLAAASIAPGRVVVESNRQTINHLDGGIVDEILVKDGQVVEQGEVLVPPAAVA